MARLDPTVVALVALAVAGCSLFTEPATRADPYSLTLMNPSVTVAQGGAGSVTVLVNRADGYSGEVELGISGVPAGVTATVAPRATSEVSASVRFTATAAAAIGTHAVTITGTAPGGRDQVTTLTLAVIAPPGTSRVTIAPFCTRFYGDFPGEIGPTWVAYQNEGYDWKVAAGRDSAFARLFTFDATERLAVALVHDWADGSDMHILYVGRTELPTLGSALKCDPPRSLSGSITGLAGGQAGLVAMGSYRAPFWGAPLVHYNLIAEPRPLDLVATRTILGAGSPYGPDRMIIHRSVDLPDGSTISPLDFASDGFDLASNTVSIIGVHAGEQFEVDSHLRTATATFAQLGSTRRTSGSAAVVLSSVPAAHLASGDLHGLSIDASAHDEAPGRGYVAYYGSPGDRTVELGPALSPPVVNAIATSPYVRVRVRLVSQPEYGSLARLTFYQLSSTFNREFTVTATAGYHGGRPGSWDLAIPDFGTVPGMDARWLPVAGETSYYVEAHGGRFVEPRFGGLPVHLGAIAPANGDVSRYAYRPGRVNVSR